MPPAPCALSQSLPAAAAATAGAADVGPLMLQLLVPLLQLLLLPARSMLP